MGCTRMAGFDYPMDTKFMTVSCSVLSTFSKIYGNEASLIQKDGESREEFLARVVRGRDQRLHFGRIKVVIC